MCNPSVEGKKWVQQTKQSCTKWDEKKIIRAKQPKLPKNLELHIVHVQLTISHFPI